MQMPKSRLASLFKYVNPDLILGGNHILSRNPTVYLRTHEVTWPIYDLEKDEFEPDASKYLSEQEMQDLSDIVHEQYHLRVFHFEQDVDVYGMYTEFTVVAPNENTAWNMITNKFGDEKRNEFVNDKSKYVINELDLKQPVVIGHYSCDQGDS